MRRSNSFSSLHALFAWMTLLSLTTFLCLGPLSYAAPPEGKGNNGQDNGNGVGQGGTPPGQEKKAENTSDRSNNGGGGSGVSDRASERTSSNSSIDRGRSDEAKLERLHAHQERKTLDLPYRASDTAEEKGKTHLAQAVHGGTGNANGIRGRGAAEAHVDSLLKSLNKFEHARWDYNPKDTRGQGNMGQVDMRSPYGFDKDSGRDGSERGRAIHPEPVFDLASLVTITWGITDYYAAMYLDYLRRYYYPGGLYATSPGASWAISYFEKIIASYNSLPYVSVVSNTDQTINYTLSLGDVPTSFEGDTVLVTTTLTSINDYGYHYWTYDSVTKSWVYSSVDYDAGEVVLTQTQELALGDNGTFSFSYDPSTTMVNYIGGYFELATTVTEPASGATYTLTYDKQVYLFRCPYGVVYDRETGKPITGAVVTIHEADGSMAVLDKAANPNVSNPQTTDATGRYNAKLAIGKKYYLTVKASGYEEYKSGIFSERWHIVREDAGLIKSPSAAPSTPAALPAAPALLGGETTWPRGASPRGIGSTLRAQ